MGEKSGEDEVDCICNEAFLHHEVSGTRVKRLFLWQDRKHDCEYIVARNKLIGEAEEIATAEFDPVKDPIWSQRFHEAMKLLWHERDSRSTIS